MKVLSFDVGIEQILQGDREPVKLPELSSTLLPSLDHMNRRLEEVFKTVPLDHLILNSLKPTLKDPNILIPTRYQAMLARAVTALKRAAAKRSGRSGGKAIEKAADQLETEKELMALLHLYRNILHQA
jgi:hypothetical protein